MADTDITKRTPGPWTVKPPSGKSTGPFRDDTYCVRAFSRSAVPVDICDVFAYAPLGNGDKCRIAAEANAAFIVEACNSYDTLRAREQDLVEALIQARGALLLDHMVDDNGEPYGTTVVALEAINAVLSKVKG